jgi:phage terminase small subunit
MADMHTDAERDYVLGKKYQDIADKYGVSVNTVKSWKRRYKWKRVITNGAPKKEKRVQTNKGCKQVQYAPVILLKEENELTEKQKLFCQFFANNNNATQAAIKAGYSKQTARMIGYENLTKPYIRLEVNRLKKIMQQSVMLSPDDIVERYMRIAFSDMTDVAEWGTELIPDIDAAGNMQVDHEGNIKMIRRNYFTFKNHDEVDGGLICEIKMGRQGLSVKLEDRQKALAWLADYFNMNPMNKHKMQYDNAVLALRKKESEKDDW